LGSSISGNSWPGLRFSRIAHLHSDNDETLHHALGNCPSSAGVKSPSTST
jgi:hypothetical protein